MNTADALQPCRPALPGRGEEVPDFKPAVLCAGRACPPRDLQRQTSVLYKPMSCRFCGCLSRILSTVVPPGDCGAVGLLMVSHQRSDRRDHLRVLVQHVVRNFKYGPRPGTVDDQSRLACTSGTTSRRFRCSMDISPSARCRPRQQPRIRQGGGKDDGPRRELLERWKKAGLVCALGKLSIPIVRFLF